MARYELRNAEDAVVNVILLEEGAIWPIPDGHSLVLLPEPIPPIPTFDDQQREAKVRLAAIRYQHETAGVEVDGSSIDTSRDSQALINGAWSTAQMDPEVMFDFKRADGTWTTLSAEAAIFVARGVSRYVQACFSRERALSELIDATVDVAGLNAIDLETGWPA